MNKLRGTSSVYSATYAIQDQNMKIVYWDEKGKHTIDPPFDSYFYLRKQDIQKLTLASQKTGIPILRMQETLYTTLEKEPVVKVSVKFPYQVRALREHMTCLTYEADIPYIRRWMLDTQTKCDEKYENIAFIDIECDDSKGFPRSDREKIISIAVVSDKGEEFFFGNEVDILKNFWAYITHHKFTMLSAWNGVEFDFPYIWKRMEIYKIPFERDQVRWVDFLGLYAVITGSRVGLDLETVAQRELKLGKTFHRSKKIKVSDLAQQDVQKLREYNVTDCILTKRVVEKLKLKELLIKLARESHLFPDEVCAFGTPSPLIDLILLESSKGLNYVLPSKQDNKKKKHYRGAVVLPTVLGVHRMVLQLDFDSLYPNTVISWMISPDKEKLLLPEFMQKYIQRKQDAEARGESLERMAYKIILNAAYGVFASKNFRAYQPAIAEEIAGRARDFLLSILHIFRDVMGFRVLAGDTDSLFIDLLPYVDEDHLENLDILIPNTMKEFESHFQAFWKDKVTVDNLKLAVECVWSKIMFFLKADKKDSSKKKRAGYIIRDKKGKILNPPKYEIKGIESKKQDWTELAKDVQETLIKFKLNDAEQVVIDSYLEQIREDLMAGKLNDKLVKRVSITKPLSEYKAHTQHLRALEKLTPDLISIIVATGYIEYVMCKGNNPVAFFDELPADIDYTWYWNKQVVPIAQRCQVDAKLIREFTNKKKQRELDYEVMDKFF